MSAFFSPLLSLLLFATLYYSTYSSYSLLFNVPLFYPPFLGLITDPMSVHREAKNVNNWSEEEKKIFKEKFVYCCSALKSIMFIVRFILFPKNFEKIASFLPHKVCLHACNVNVCTMYMVNVCFYIMSTLYMHVLYMYIYVHVHWFICQTMYMYV